MKLAAHYTRSNLIITASVLVIGAIIYYFTINYIIQKQLDRDLTEEMAEVVTYINTKQKLPQQVDFDEEQTVFTETNQTNIRMHFYDAPYKAAVSNTDDDDDNNGRAVENLVSLNGKNYKVTITISRSGTEYLVQLIATITAILMAGLLIILFLTNRFVLKGLWKPFFFMLNRLKSFSVSDTFLLTSIKNNVDEFNELDTAINQMSSRVKNDFKTLKQFTENASHEMMTPLSVITSKLDTLIQDETLKPEHYKQLQDIYSASGKLSRLNHSLLLLVKIENNLIDESETLYLDKLVIEKIEQFQELIISRDIVVATNIHPKQLQVSKYLMDILLNNLFSNAIRHNIDHGSLIISVTDDSLTIQNSGAVLSTEEHIFERFQKGKKSEGTGLGLAIVKNICTLYAWQIAYSYTDAMHTIQIMFK